MTAGASSPPPLHPPRVKPVARPFHHRIAPWLALPLLVSLTTGLAYRIGRSWFAMDKPTGQKILDVHTGTVLGEIPSHFYVAATGLGLLGLALSGAWLLVKSRAPSGPRRLHRLAAWVVLVPLIATASTGLGYHFGEAWLGLDAKTLKLLMNIHQGSWLGPTYRPFYVLLVGLGLLWLVVSGLGMLRKKPALAAKPAEPTR